MPTRSESSTLLFDRTLSRTFDEFPYIMDVDCFDLLPPRAKDLLGPDYVPTNLVTALPVVSLEQPLSPPRLRLAA